MKRYLLTIIIMVGCGTEDGNRTVETQEDLPQCDMTSREVVYIESEDQFWKCDGAGQSWQPVELTDDRGLCTRITSPEDVDGWKGYARRKYCG